jgi:hypothetical protein
MLNVSVRPQPAAVAECLRPQPLLGETSSDEIAAVIYRPRLPCLQPRNRSSTLAVTRCFRFWNRRISSACAALAKFVSLVQVGNVGPGLTIILSGRVDIDQPPLSGPGGMLV